MAYEEDVAARVRNALASAPRVMERKMFGGLAFMVHGHMAVGVVGEELMVRVGAHAYKKALTRPHVREMDFTGRPLRGFVYVAPEGFRTARDLNTWVRMALAFVSVHEPKKARPGTGRPRKKAPPARKARTAKHRPPPVVGTPRRRK